MKNITTCYMPEINLLEISLKYGNNYDYSEIFKVIYDHRGCEIIIRDVFSTESLNSICSLLSVLDYDGNITIDLTKQKDVTDGIEDIKNGDYIKLDLLPSNVKVKGFVKDNLQTEFSTWAHNLNPIGKNNVLRVLTKEDRSVFLNQSQVIQKFKKEFVHYLTLSYKLPEKNDKTAFEFLDTLSEMERFELIFNYLHTYFASISDEAPKEYDDAVQIFKDGAGSSKGLAHLLTLLANNSFFKLNCTPVEGVTSDGKHHTWNLFVDSNNNIYQYDLEHDIVGKSFDDCRRTITKLYSSVAALEENFGNPSNEAPTGSYKPVLPYTFRMKNKNNNNDTKQD